MTCCWLVSSKNPSAMQVKTNVLINLHLWFEKISNFHSSSTLSALKRRWSISRMKIVGRSFVYIILMAICGKKTEEFILSLQWFWGVDAWCLLNYMPKPRRWRFRALEISLPWVFLFSKLLHQLLWHLFNSDSYILIPNKKNWKILPLNSEDWNLMVNITALDNFRLDKLPP